MAKANIWFLILILVVSCTPAKKTGKVSPDNLSSIPDNDEMVVKAVISNIGTLHKGFWFVWDSTKLQVPKFEFFQKTIDKDTFDQLQAILLGKNKTRAKIDMNISYLNDTDLAKVDANYFHNPTVSNAKEWRTTFQKKYPGFLGIITFSQIAYSFGQNYAYLYFEIYTGPGSASGDLYLLSKKNNYWKVIYSRNVFKSKGH